MDGQHLISHHPASSYPEHVACNMQHALRRRYDALSNTKEANCIIGKYLQALFRSVDIPEQQAMTALHSDQHRYLGGRRDQELALCYLCHWQGWPFGHSLKVHEFQMEQKVPANVCSIRATVQGTATSHPLQLCNITASSKHIRLRLIWLELRQAFVNFVFVSHAAMGHGELDEWYSVVGHHCFFRSSCRVDKGSKSYQSILRHQHIPIVRQKPWDAIKYLQGWRDSI